MTDSAGHSLPTLQEAMDVLKSLSDPSRPIRMIAFRPVLGSFRHAETGEVPNDALQTLQQIGHDGPRTFVRTEFRTSIPMQPEPTEEPGLRVEGYIDLAFGLLIGYEFPADESEPRRLVFAKIQAVIHSWPYWRTFVSASLSLLGVASQVVPLVPQTQAAKMAGFKEPNSETVSSTLPPMGKQ